MTLACSFLLAVTVVACDSSNGLPVPGAADDGFDAAFDVGADPNPPSVTYYGEVEPLLARRCVRCHRTGQVSGIPLDTYERAAALSDVIARETQRRAMPPFQADNSGSCNKFDTELWLSDDEIETLRVWADEDAPIGEPHPDATPVTQPEGLSGDAVVLDTGVGWAPDPDRGSQYRCFVVPTGLDEPTYVTGLEARPEHPELVHHVVVWNLDSSDVARAQALDRASEGEGYDCFGGPGAALPVVLGIWAPGQGAVKYPDRTGILLRDHRHVVIQVQYEPRGASSLERTRVLLETEDRVEPAMLLGTGGLNMGLIPGLPRADTLHDQPHPLVGPLPQTSRVPLRVHGVLPHMHDTGRTLRLEHFRGDDGACILRVPDWDFGWQRFYFFERPISSRPGDFYRLRCSYDTRGRTDYVGWGEDEDDEMCLAFLYATVDKNSSETTAPSEMSDALDPMPGAYTRGVSPARRRDEVIGVEVGDHVLDVAFDGLGNLYVATVRPYSADDPRTPAEGSTAFGELAKLAPDGELLWALTVDGPDLDQVTAVTPRPDGSVLVTGSFHDEATLHSPGGARWSMTSVGGDADVFLAHVSPDGDVLRQPTVFGGPGDDRGKPGALVVDEATGSIWTVVKLERPMTFGDIELPAGSVDKVPALLRVGVDGTPLWGTSLLIDGPMEFLTDPRIGRIHAIDLDEAGNVYFAGFFRGTITLPGGAQLTARGFTDGFVGSITPAGELRWAHQIGDRNLDVLFGAALDSAGNVLVSGWVTGPARIVDTAGAETSTLSELPMGAHSGGQDGVLASFTSDGELRWLRQVGGQYTERFFETVPRDDGGIIVVANYMGPGDFGGGPLYGRAMDAALVGYDLDGKHQFSWRIGTDGLEHSRWMAMHGNTVAAGWQPLTPTETPGARVTRFELPR